MQWICVCLFFFCVQALSTLFTSPSVSSSAWLLNRRQRLSIHDVLHLAHLHTDSLLDAVQVRFFSYLFVCVYLHSVFLFWQENYLLKWSQYETSTQHVSPFLDNTRRISLKNQQKYVLVGSFCPLLSPLIEWVGCLFNAGRGKWYQQVKIGGKGWNQTKPQWKAFVTHFLILTFWSRMVLFWTKTFFVVCIDIVICFVARADMGGFSFDSTCVSSDAAFTLSLWTNHLICSVPASSRDSRIKFTFPGQSVDCRQRKEQTAEHLKTFLHLSYSANNACSGSMRKFVMDQLFTGGWQQTMCVYRLTCNNTRLYSQDCLQFQWTRRKTTLTIPMTQIKWIVIFILHGSWNNEMRWLAFKFLFFVVFPVFLPLMLDHHAIRSQRCLCQSDTNFLPTVSFLEQQTVTSNTAFYGEVVY